MTAAALAPPRGDATNTLEAAQYPAGLPARHGLDADLSGPDRRPAAQRAGRPAVGAGPRPASGRTLTEDRVLASLRLSFGTSFLAALTNVPLGLLVGWTLTRYEFPGRRIIDAFVDLPFALPTAVAGIALTAIYSPNGPLGALFAQVGIKTAYSPLGDLHRPAVHRPAVRGAHHPAGAAGP